MLLILMEYFVALLIPVGYGTALNNAQMTRPF